MYHHTICFIYIDSGRWKHIPSSSLNRVWILVSVLLPLQWNCSNTACSCAISLFVYQLQWFINQIKTKDDQIPHVLKNTVCVCLSYIYCHIWHHDVIFISMQLYVTHGKQMIVVLWWVIKINVALNESATKIRWNKLKCSVFILHRKILQYVWNVRLNMFHNQCVTC
jgi:hypothetical protein